MKTYKDLKEFLQKNEHLDNLAICLNGMSTLFSKIEVEFNERNNSLNFILYSSIPMNTYLKLPLELVDKLGLCSNYLDLMIDKVDKNDIYYNSNRYINPSKALIFRIKEEDEEIVNKFVEESINKNLLDRIDYIEERAYDNGYEDGRCASIDDVKEEYVNRLLRLKERLESCLMYFEKVINVVKSTYEVNIVREFNAGHIDHYDLNRLKEFEDRVNLFKEQINEEFYGKQ